MNTSEIGAASEAAVMAALLKAGKVVLTPFGGSRRYDLVIEQGGVFIRVQCKTGRLKDGAIMFRTESVTRSSGGTSRRDYRGDVDYFGVYCPELDECYLVPISEVGRTMGTLRVTTPANNQSRRVKPAANYIVR